MFTFPICLFGIGAIKEPWSLVGASYDNKSFSVATQELNSEDVFFKPDGTKFYIVGYTNDTVYQYSCSTAWDVSTASYDTKSFSVASEELAPRALFFKSDGTKLYVMGSGNDKIFQYTLSTAWDVSTASYDTKSLDVKPQDGQPQGFSISTDGTKVYMTGWNSNTVYQYTLSTAWDLSTGTYDTVSFSIATEVSSATGIFFKPDGTKFYAVNGLVYQYTLSTAWDLSTASYDGVSFDATEYTNSSGLFFKTDDGTKLYIMVYDDKIYQYSLG